MAKKISCTISERFGVRNLLNESYQRGGLSLDMLVSASKVSEKCGIEIELDKPNKEGVAFAKGGEEAKAVNLRQTVVAGTDGRPTVQLLWDAKQDKGTVLEFTSNEVQLLQDLIKNKSDKKELTLSDMWVVGFSEKINKKEE